MTKLVITALAVMSAAALQAFQPRPAPPALADPAVFTFTDFVATRMQPPMDEATLLTGLDLLYCAVEGVALAQDITDDVIRQVHHLRREARRLYPAANTREITVARQRHFESAARLLTMLNDALPAQHQIAKARVEAVDRAARSLELDNPLRKQPHSVERFFRHAAAALQVAQP